MERKIPIHPAKIGKRVTEARPVETPLRTGVVFGGSSGIGAAVVERMSTKIGRIIAASRRASAPSISNVTAVFCDIREPSNVADVLQIANQSGGIDWVVNAAGVGFYAPMTKAFHAQWLNIIDTNILGTINLIAQLQTLEKPIVHYVQIGSLAALRTSQTPGNDVYGAAKAAAATLLFRHRTELRAAGNLTKITLIIPGYVGKTDFVRNYFQHLPEERKPLLNRFEPLSPMDVAATIEYALELPSHIELSEIIVRPLGQPD